MATKTITATYNAGYTLSASFQALSITSSGYIFGIGGTYGASGAATAAGGAGQDALLMNYHANAFNFGKLLGAAGGHGGVSSGAAEGGEGGGGGAGVRLNAAGVVVNFNSIEGGGGGDGGSSAAGVGGEGGYGASGVALLTGGESFRNTGTLVAGAGGAGGDAPAHAGRGGFGGDAVDQKYSGSIDNSGLILGGAGGAAGLGDAASAPGYGYDMGGVGGLGIRMAVYTTLTNTGTIDGGAGATGGAGTLYGSRGGQGGEAVLTEIDHSSVINHGTIVGGAGAGGGGAGKIKTFNGDGGGGGNGGGGVYGSDVTNSGVIVGGAGGSGGFGSHSGGAGNTGGSAISDFFGFTIFNTGLIEGGAGGAGGAGLVYGGAGAHGGYGIVLDNGLVTNLGTIEGGLGGADGGGISHGPAGANVSGVLIAGGRVINGSSAITTAVISGGIGVQVGAIDVAPLTIINYGTIAGSGPVGVYLVAAHDTLISETGSQIVGVVEAKGGAIGFGGVAGTFSGLGSGTIAGSVPMTITGAGAYEIEAGGKWTLTGDGSITAAASLTVFGQLTVAGSLNAYGGPIDVAKGGLMRVTGEVGNDFTLTVAGTVIDTGSLRNLGPSDLIVVENGGQVQIENTVTNPGTIVLGGASALTDLRVLGTGATLQSGGFVELSGTKSRILGLTPGTTFYNYDNVISGQGFIGLSSMALINGTTAKIIAKGKQGLVINTKGSTSVNHGAIEAFTGSNLVIQSSLFEQSASGVIAALTGGVVDLEDDVISGGTISQAGSGVLKANVTGGALETVVIDGVLEVVAGVTETVEGEITNTGKIDTFGGATAAKLIVGSIGLTLTGGGQLNTNPNLNNTITGVSTVAVLDNLDNRISGAGALGAGKMTLVNGAKGAIVGNSNLTLTIDTGANTIANAGLIESAGTGAVVVKSAVANTGTLFAAAGILTLDGAVTGPGIGQIKTGVLNIAAGDAESVTFVSGSTGQLRLTDFKDFTGSVKGLSTTGSNSIDLVGMAFSAANSKATYSGTSASGVLKVTNGVVTAFIALVGNYLGHTFTVSSDGAGGSKVVDPPAAGPLAQAAAGFRPLPPAASAYVLRLPPTQTPFVHAP